MPQKKLCFGNLEDRQLMIAGVSSLADAVKVTMGPGGRNVVLQKSFGAPTCTKDGVSVAKEIEFKDAFMNMGAQMLKEVALQHSHNASSLFKDRAPSDPAVAKLLTELTNEANAARNA